jgi:hypothetical protein
VIVPRFVATAVAAVITVVAAGCGGPSPGAETPVPLQPSPLPAPSVVDPSLADYIEALFLGSGPLIPRDGVPACVYQGRWARWTKAATVRILISTTASASTRDSVQRLADQIAVATRGEIRATMTVTADRDPLPAPGEVTMTLHPNPVSTGCQFSRGCVHIGYGTNVLVSARAVLDNTVPPRGWAHELGHAILGMCHVDGLLIGGAGNSMMSAGPDVFSSDISDGLSARDLLASQTVYGASLEPLASRDDFIRAGLVRGIPGPSAASAFQPGGRRTIDEPPER